MRPEGSDPATLKYRSATYLSSLTAAKSRNIHSLISFEVPYALIGRVGDSSSA